MKTLLPSQLQHCIRNSSSCFQFECCGYFCFVVQYYNTLLLLYYLFLWLKIYFTLFLFLGLQTGQDARFYASSARFEPFSNEGKPLVIQFTVKHEQKIDCGGGYVKVFPADLVQTEMHGDSSYYIMFGR